MALAMGVMLAAATPAVAVELDLPGSYGNADGCSYLKTFDLTGDELRYLTPKGLSTYGASCEVVAVHADAGGNQLAQAICHHEGEELLTAEDFIITPPDASGGVRIYTGAGDVWADLEPCT